MHPACSRINKLNIECTWHPIFGLQICYVDASGNLMRNMQSLLLLFNAKLVPSMQLKLLVRIVFFGHGAIKAAGQRRLVHA